MRNNPLERKFIGVDKINVNNNSYVENPKRELELLKIEDKNIKINFSLDYLNNLKENVGIIDEDRENFKKKYGFGEIEKNEEKNENSDRLEPNKELIDLYDIKIISNEEEKSKSIIILLLNYLIKLNLI